MSNNKQSSIDWLVEILGKYNEEMVFLYQNEIEQAKAMHKEEIIHAYNHSWHFRDSPYETAEKYYKEIYGDGIQ